MVTNLVRIWDIAGTDNILKLETKPFSGEVYVIPPAIYRFSVSYDLSASQPHSDRLGGLYQISDQCI